MPVLTLILFMYYGIFICELISLFDDEEVIAYILLMILFLLFFVEINSVNDCFDACFDTSSYILLTFFQCFYFYCDY